MKIFCRNQYQKGWQYQRFIKDFNLISKSLGKELKITKNWEISVLFCTNNFIKDLNTKYRNKNKKTDVLSFPVNKKTDKINIKTLILGDIVIAIDVCKIQAKKYNHSMRREMSFLYLHGLLHLLYYNHIEKKDAKIMFKLQTKILNQLKIRR